MSKLATITSLDFNVSSHWDGSGIAEARRDIDALRADLDRIGAMRETATVTVAVDNSSLDSVRRSLAEVGQIHETAHVTVEADTAAITRVREQLDAVGRIRETAHVTVEADTAAIARVRAELAAIPNRITTHVDVDTDRAHAGLSTITRDAEDVVSHLGGIGGAAGGAGGGLTSMGGAASSAGGSVGGLVTVLGYAALAMAAIGPVAALAAGAIMGVLGGAFIGLGALILSKTNEVSVTMKKFKSGLEQDMGQAALAMKTPLLNGINELMVGLHALTPAFTQAFGAAGKLIKPLVDSFLSFTGNVMPGVIKALQAAVPVFDGLRTGAAALGAGMSQMFTGLAAGAKGAGSAIATTLGGIGQILGIIGKAFGEMAGAGAIALKGLMSGLTSLVSGAMAGFVQGVKLMSGTLGPFLAALGKFAGQILQGLLPALASLMSALMGGLTPILKALGPVFIVVGSAIAKVGQALAPVLAIFGQLVAHVITALMPALTQLALMWAKQFGLIAQQMIPVLMQLMPSIVQVATAFGKIIIAVTPLLPVMAQFDVVALKVLSAMMPLITGLLQVVAVIMGAFAAAIKFIVGLIVNWGDTWHTVTQAFITAWNAVSGALEAAWNTVWNAMKVAAQAVWDAMKAAWNTVVQAFTTVWNTVSSALSAAWSTVWNAMKTVAEAIWTGLQAAWSTFINALHTIWTTVSSALSAAWSTVWNAMKTAAQAVWNALQAAWQTFLNAVRTIWNTVSSGLSAAWSTVWNAMKTAAETIWNALKAAWQTFLNGVRTIWNTVSSGLKAAWEAVWTAIKGFATSTWNAIKGAWNTFLNAMRSIWDTISGGLKRAWQGTWDTMKKALSTFVDAAKTVWNGLKKAFEEPIHFVIATVLNGGIIKAIDWVISKLGGPSKAIPDIPVPFADGGHVRGPGTSTSDSIPARLSDGEFVMKADAVRRIGVDKLYAMNSGSVPGGAAATLAANMSGGFADGGLSIGDIESMFTDIIKTIGGAGAGALADAVKSAGSVAKAIGSGVKGAADAVGNAAGHVPVVGGAAKSIIKGIGGIFGGGGKKVSQAANAIAGALDAWGQKEFNSAAGDLINKVFDKLPIIDGKGPLGIMGGEATKMIMKAGANKLKSFIADFLFKKQQEQIAVTSSKVAGTKAVKAWAPVVLQALQMTGHPASWLGPILQMMARESGGNPNAINRTDINAQHGIPSQGLMQVIPPTFAANHEPGTSNNILDPLANIAAAINYIAKVPSRLGKTPYAAGTNNATPGMHLVGENGPEMVLFGGGETVKTAGETALGSGGGGGIDSEKLAKNLSAWQSYMTSVKQASDNTWTGVRTMSEGTWTQMQNAMTPFSQGLVRSVSDSGSAMVNDSKNTWTNIRNFARNNWAEQTAESVKMNADMQKNFSETGASVQAQSKADWTGIKTFAQQTWADQTAESIKFNSDMQKDFSDTGSNMLAKWKADWTDNTTFTNKTWSDDKTNATTFSNDLIKTFSDTGNTLDTNWKTALTTNSTDTNTYWTNTKATYTAGQQWLTGTFFPPVNDLMVNKLPQSFATSVSNIGSGWIGLENASRNPVAAVVDVVYNKGIVGVWNLIAKAFGAPTLSTFTMPGFATGGAVNGPGTGTSDSVVARLSTGEHVWTAAEVNAAGGHRQVANMRAGVLGGQARAYGNGDGRYAAGGAVVPTAGAGAPGGNPTTPTGGGTGLAGLASATLGSIHQIANPLIQAAVTAGKTAVDAVTVAGSGMRAVGENMGTNMGKLATDYITANDILPTIGGGSDASAQAWADAQVGKPYALGGNFGATFDCSQYMSGIARAILGETPAPWFTTFAFNGATAPTGFKQNLQAPFMVGVTNAGVGHMAGTLNGTNYEATPPAVRKGPNARGWNDPMFPMHYGFEPSVQAATIGGVTSANHLAIIDAALAAAGVPPPSTKADWEDGMNIIITHESAWNASAINLTDSNAAAGIPSQGLAQVIPPTFSAYHVPGTSTNILDPIANVAAAINYIVHVYGTIANVPGVRSIRAGGAYLPYRNGTKSAMPGMGFVGEEGPEFMEMGGGGQRIHSFDDIMHKIGEIASSNQTDSDWKAKLAECLKELKDQTGISVNVPITVHGGGDSKEVVRQVEAELLPKLRMLLQQHTGRRSH